MKLKKLSISLILLICVTIIAPLITSFFIQNFKFTYQNIPLHSTIEAMGGVIAFTIAIIFFIKNKYASHMTYFNWASLALLAMEIIDIFHAMTMPGKLFVWLHSIAVFTGGLLFMSVWFKDKIVEKNHYKIIPLVLIVFSFCVSLFSIYFEEYIPVMIDSNGNFTNTANLLNIIGGIGFFIASFKFIKEYIKKHDFEDFLFAGHTLLFGVSGVLFLTSTIWDAQWWLWHILRLSAYSLAMYYVYIDFAKEIKLLYISNTELIESQTKLTRYIDIVNKNVIISTTNLNGTIVSVSDAFCKMTGYTKDELIGKQHDIVKDPHLPHKIYNDMWKTIESNKIWKGEMTNIKKDGSVFWVDSIVEPIFDINGKKIGYTSIRQDISDKKKIEELSITDALTSLYNRRFFNEIFPKFINSAKRNDYFIGFCILDIDYFKQFNDNYGHQLGDIVLEKVGRTIKNSFLRADDYTFRLGGEEFGILFSVESKEKAYEYISILRERINTLHITHEYSLVSQFISASYGLSCLLASEISDHKNLYKETDILLYKAKAEGRDRIISNS